MTLSHAAHHRRYAPTLGVATLVAAGLLAALLVFAPAPPLRPYALRAAPAPAVDVLAPMRLLQVETVAGEPSAESVVGPAADLEPPTRLPLATVQAPPATLPRVATGVVRFDFVPITNDMLATEALFRMQPVFDALPPSLPMDRVVVVKVRVADDGEVVEAHVTKGLDRTLDQQALQAAWHYRLAGHGKGERPDWVTLPYEFLGRP
jgi:hypothetical protein